jgi:uncharacterized protein (DUF486 family)
MENAISFSHEGSQGSRRIAGVSNDIYSIRVEHVKMFFMNASILSWPVLRTVLLLTASNCFMTVAWYGHLKFKSAPLWIAILASWGLAFFEYLLQVPANRLGYGTLSAYQLKVLQEAITLGVFMLFAWLALGETPSFRYLLSFSLIFGAVAVAFYK